MTPFTESVIEDAALAWLESIGWRVTHGPDIAPDMPTAERRDYGKVVLAQRLRDALARLNPALPADALEDAFRKLTRPEGADLIQRNRALHRLLVNGVTVEYRMPAGEIRGAQARVVDFDRVEANDWLAVNQFSVTETISPGAKWDATGGLAGAGSMEGACSKHSRRPDVVLFVNGLPLAVVEFKSAVDEDATIWTAFQQLQTYKAEIASLFATNAVLVVSDGVEARVGTLSAGREWFKKFFPEDKSAGKPIWTAEGRPEGARAMDGLMQAIARVNRVFKDKPGGLVVDHLGLAQELKTALATYTESGGTGRTALDQDEAVAVMREKYEVCYGLFHGFDRSKWTTGTPQERLGLLPAAQEHILKQENGKDRCIRAVRELSQAFALAVPHDEALRIRDDVAFFQAVQAVLAKRAPGDVRPEEELDQAVRQIISRVVAPEGMVDIFAAAGLVKPDLSILADDFLAEVRGMPQKNLAVELLQKLLKGELNTRRRKNVVQARSFAEMLERTIHRYQNRAIEAAQVIEELIQLAKDMRAANARGESLGLTDDELAFYDALETNDSAVKVLGDKTLRTIARELVATVRHNVTIDWTLRENVRAQLRVLVKRILHKYGYPPDKQEKATQTVLEQAEMLSQAWARDSE